MLKKCDTYSVQLICCSSLPGDAKHVAAHLPQPLGQVIISRGPWAACRRTVAEIASALALQAWFHSTKDGGLGSLHCCLSKNPEDLHCYLYALVLVPPQVRLDHPRVQRKDTDTSSCSINKRKLYIKLEF